MRHSSLTPKLQMFKKLRQVRAVLKTNSYLKSYLLRYLEESLAQTIGLFRAKGINIGNLVEGFKFPVGQEGYVTVVKMGVEAKGILLGQINVNGMTFNVYFSFTKDW
jgi:hypothetical protein